MTAVNSDDDVAVTVPGEGGVEHDGLPFSVGEIEVARKDLHKGSSILDEAAAEVGLVGVSHIDGAVGVVGVSRQILGFVSPCNNVARTVDIGTVEDNLGVAVIVGGITGEVGGGLSADGGVGCHVGIVAE